LIGVNDPCHTSCNQPNITKQSLSTGAKQTRAKGFFIQAIRQSNERTLVDKHGAFSQLTKTTEKAQNLFNYRGKNDT
jgi:hypothetical protein